MKGESRDQKHTPGLQSHGAESSLRGRVRGVSRKSTRLRRSSDLAPETPEPGLRASGSVVAPPAMNPFSFRSASPSSPVYPLSRRSQQRRPLFFFFFLQLAEVFYRSVTCVHRVAASRGWVWISPPDPRAREKAPQAPGAGEGAASCVPAARLLPRARFPRLAPRVTEARGRRVNAPDRSAPLARAHASTRIPDRPAPGGLPTGPPSLARTAAFRLPDSAMPAGGTFLML